jgi:membrane dipeptidase
MSEIGNQNHKRHEISEEARRLHEQSIVIDLHIDPIVQQLLFGYDLRQEHNSSWRPQKRRLVFYLAQIYARLRRLHGPFFNHIDLPRMLKGGYTFGAFGVHYWPVQSEMGWKAIKKQMTYFNQMVDQDDRIIFAKRPQDIHQAFKKGKLAGFLGVEGAHCLGKGGKKTMKIRLDRVEELFESYGVRYLTLAHFSKNDAATPSMGLGCNDSEGLTDFGKDLIGKMNELGMIVDVAHVNNQGVLDACKVSKKPVVVTHTGVAAINPHRRNLTDEAVKAVAETGGVIGIMFATNFLSNSRENPPSDIVLKHVDHVVNLVGEDHAALGTDFDGWIPRIPQDMEDAKDLPWLTQIMVNRGYNGSQVKKILGENFLRVWQEVSKEALPPSYFQRSKQ